MTKQFSCKADGGQDLPALGSMGLLAVGLLALAVFSWYVGQAVQREVT